MCGIAGIIGRIVEPNRAALGRMSAAMVHRGPDAHGTWQSVPDARGWGVMLAHRRLSILDLSPAGAQPMVDGATGDALVLNGEIYNYVELRQRLKDSGPPFQSTGDTEVMLRALAAGGLAALPSLRGMFAFAFWDATERTLSLARDPLGIKPLYVAVNPDRHGEWSVAFASEVRSFLASGLLGTPRLHPPRPASVAWNGFVVGPQTAVAGVESLAPGQVRVFDGAGTERVAHDYWSMAQRPASEAREGQPLEALVEECVRLHLASDVPLAVFLSGGVDSSAVANLAQRTSGTPIHTFTLAFEEAEYNEGPDARRIAAAIGTQHQEVVLTEQRFVGHLDAALDSLDQPTFDGLNSYYMSQAIREAGFTVALVGTGGDELFGGYTSFRDLPILQRWSRRARWIPSAWREAAARLVASTMQRSTGAISPQTRWAKLPEMVRRGDDLLALYQLAYALFLPDFQAQLLTSRDVTGSSTACLRRRATRSSARHGRAHRSRPSASWSSDCSWASGCCATTTPRAWRLRSSSASRWSTRCSSKPSTACRTTCAIIPSGGRRCSGGSASAGSTRRSSSGPRAGSCFRSIGGSGGAWARPWTRPCGTRRPSGRPASSRRRWGGSGRPSSDGAPGIYWSRVWALFALVRWSQRHGVYL